MLFRSIPKSRWLAFFGEFQSKITEGWQQNPSLLLQAPKIHWVGWRSGRGQILTKDKEGNDRLVEKLDGHVIRIKGKECTLHVNFNNKELRPEGTWCGVFLPAYHLSPELEICKILAGSGFNGGTTEARTRARICSGGTWIRFHADPELTKELLAIQSANLAPASWVGVDVKIRIFGKEEETIVDPSDAEEEKIGRAHV